MPFLLSFLLLFFFSSVCWPQKPPPTPPSSSNPRSPIIQQRFLSIRGFVRYSDTERAAEMVKVDLKVFTGATVESTFTRSNGDFEFNRLRPGTYILVVEQEGYEPIRENVEIMNAPVMAVYLSLKKQIKLQPDQSGQLVSARQLAIPRKAQDAMEKGLNRLYGKQDYKGSLAQFERAVTDFPSYYEAYHEMGVAYIHLGQPAEAEKAFRKSIEVSKSHYSGAYFALASLLSTKQRFAEAEPLVRQGLELDRNAWEGHYELARALLGLNRVDAAEKSAEEARTRKPDFPPLFLLLANIHIRKHDYPTLLQDLDSYLKLEPNGPTSEQARQTREKIQRALSNAQNAPTVPPPKP
jgi:tetratricopeptide (TPR) repeat protein